MFLSRQGLFDIELDELEIHKKLFGRDSPLVKYMNILKYRDTEKIKLVSQYD